MRLDKYLFDFGYVKSRSAAENLVKSGCVSFDGKVMTKPSFDVNETEPHAVNVTNTCPYVSRGGLKLEKALRVFDVDVNGLCALDVGASTGGFTDCLLQNGVRRVFAVDSGVGQLMPWLLADGRVTNMEKYNARHMKPSDFDEKIDIAVMDVSFISQTLILPGLASVLGEGGLLISLVKPQFEAGREAVGKGGIVKSKKERCAAVLRVLACAESLGFGCLGFASSPILGGDGNREYIAAFRLGGASFVSESDVKQTMENEKNSGGMYL